MPWSSRAGDVDVENVVVCADGLDDVEEDVGINLDNGPGRLLLNAPREKNERGGGGGFFRIDFFGVVGLIGRGLGVNGAAADNGPTGELVDDEATCDDDVPEDDEASGCG